MSSITGVTQEDKVKRICVVDYFNQSNEITFTAFRLLYRINKLTNKFGYCFAQNATLAEILKVPERSIKRGIAELRKLEAITTVIDPKTSERKIYIDDKVILLDENIADTGGCHTVSEDDRSTTPWGDVHDTRGVTCVTPIIYNSKIVTLTTNEEKEKKNSEDLFFALEVPEHIKLYVKENFQNDEHSRSKLKLILTGKFDLIYQLMSFSRTEYMADMKPYMDAIPDSTLDNFNKTFLYAFNNTTDYQYKKDMVELASYLLFKNADRIPLQNALALKMNWTKISVSKFKELRLAYDDMDRKVGEVNFNMKTLSMYDDFPTAICRYIARNKEISIGFKNNFAKSLDKRYAVN